MAASPPHSLSPPGHAEGRQRLRQLLGAERGWRGFSSLQEVPQSRRSSSSCRSGGSSDNCSRSGSSHCLGRFLLQKKKKKEMALYEFSRGAVFAAVYFLYIKNMID